MASSVYVDEVRITINRRNGDWVGDGDITATDSSALAPENSSLSLDELASELHQVVFDAAGRPAAVQIVTTYGVREQGSSSAWAHIVVELLDDVSGAAWETLLAMIVKYVQDVLRGQSDDE